MFLREGSLITLCWALRDVPDLMKYLGPGIVRVHPHWILLISPFGKLCLSVDFWLSDCLKICTWQGTVVTLLSQVQLSLRLGHRVHGHLPDCIHMGEHQHRHVMSVLFYFYLPPVTTSFPHCNAWACLRAWQKPPLGSQWSEWGCYTAIQQEIVQMHGWELCCAICPQHHRKSPNPD